MATVLFAWELGANLGHLIPLSKIAAKVREDGHRAVFAVLDVGLARQTLGPDATILQAPVWPAHRHFGARGGYASYADLLAVVGFSDPDKLAAMMGAWLALIDLVQPAAVVADHSPGLQMALRGRGIPMVTVGSAFAMAPVQADHFPPLRGDSTPSIPETRLLESLRRAEVILGRTPSPDLLAAFRSTARVVFGIPEIDPYRSFRQEALMAPPGGLPGPQKWPNGHRLFVYIGGEAQNFEAIAQALSLVNVEVEAYLRGETGPIPEFLKMRGITIHDTAPPLNEVLTRVSHIFTLGGAMTTAAAYSAGRPQLILPRHDEAELTFGLVEAQGVAMRMKVLQEPYTIAAAIDQFVADNPLAERAHETAQRLAARPVPDGGERAAAAVREAIGR